MASQFISHFYLFIVNFFFLVFQDRVLTSLVEQADLCLLSAGINTTAQPAVPTENLSWLPVSPSIHLRLSSRGADVLFWLPQSLAHLCTDTQKDKQTHKLFS